jgi:hypothetical protein
MDACVYSVFVLFCVEVVARLWADHPSKEAYRLKEAARAQNWSLEHLVAVVVQPLPITVAAWSKA